MGKLKKLFQTNFTIDIDGLLAYFFFIEVFDFIRDAPKGVEQCEFTLRIMDKLSIYLADILKDNKIDYKLLTKRLGHHPENVDKILDLSCDNCPNRKKTYLPY